ncbi:hypothetical protein ACKU05_026290 [Klebsiella pneumoniae]
MKVFGEGGGKSKSMARNAAVSGVKLHLAIDSKTHIIMQLTYR